MTFTTKHTIILMVAFVGTLFVGAGISTDWFDGFNEDNSDRDRQRAIFCEGRCLSGQNAIDKPCTHPDVAPPKAEAIHGKDLCKDKKWISSIINYNEIKKKLPGADDPDEE